MNKYSKLAKNTSVFFIANFGSKVISFLLVRFYTEFLSLEEYGTIDLLSTTVSLAFPIITLCITEAVLRFSIDDNDNRGKILTNGLFITLLGNLMFVFLAPVFMKIDVFADNVIWLYLLTLTNSFYTIIIHFSRGIGKTKLFTISGLLHTIFLVSFNILFLVVFSLGITGYFISSVLANLLIIIIVFFFGKLYSYIIKNLEKKYLKQMLLYSIPLIPNSIFWWIMQSADRYAITYILSTTENGLYSAANKIPTLITTISTVFFQAWQLSSVEEVNSTQKSSFYSNVFSKMSALLILATSFLLVILQQVYKILVEETYFSGWTCVPFLLCAMVFSCYSNFLGTNYIAMKKTNGVFLTTVVGALINVILNFILIPSMGIEGAALATMISFFMTWIFRAFGTRKFVKINYSFLYFCIPIFLILIQATMLTFGITLIYIHIVIFLSLLVIYSKDIFKFLKFALTFVLRRRR